MGNPVIAVERVVGDELEVRVSRAVVRRSESGVVTIEVRGAVVQDREAFERVAFERGASDQVGRPPRRP